jgi:hypothetical protein
MRMLAIVVLAVATVGGGPERSGGPERAGGPERSALQQPRTPIDVSRLGPQVGDRVPDFSLRDQSGTIRSLQSVIGERGALLVFIRSADW